MTNLIPIDRTLEQKHLTKIEGTKSIIAWHTSQDIQALRMTDESERLYLNGKEVHLTVHHLHPTQQVINYCMGYGDRRAMLNTWKSLQTKGGAK